MSIVDKVGRRKLMVIFIPGMMVAFTWTIISFHCMSILSLPVGIVIDLSLRPYEADWRSFAGGLPVSDCLGW